jgi:hypothetical protein
MKMCPVICRFKKQLSSLYLCFLGDKDAALVFQQVDNALRDPRHKPIPGEESVIGHFLIGLLPVLVKKLFSSL